MNMKRVWPRAILGTTGLGAGIAPAFANETADHHGRSFM